TGTRNPTSAAEKTWKRTTRQVGQRNSQTHGQVHNALTGDAQPDCNMDSPTGNNDSSSLPRERAATTKTTQGSFGENLHQKRQEPSWENFTRTRPNQTTHFEPQGKHNELQKQRKPVLGEPPPEPPRHPSGKNPPERTSQTNNAPHTLRWHDNSRNEHKTVLRETLTRTTANGSGKPH
ncbi:hypothetical protein Taro_019116, partial [Colocasia esculenta]|nr:hypothetical protein [Colocasia esculenta]